MIINIYGGNFMERKRGNNRGYSAKAYALGVAIVVFFIGCVVGMFYFSKREPMMCVFILGLFFLVFGLIGISSDIKGKTLKKNLQMFIFPIVGLGCMIYASIAMWGDKFHITLSEKCAPVLILCLFILAGGGMVLGRVLTIKGKKEKYTVVTAKCVGLDRQYSGNTSVYAPIYSYCYNGIEYNTKLNFYSNIDVSKVGTKEDIYINPNNPKEIYRPSIKQSMGIIILGIIIAASGIVGLYFLYTVK